MDKENVATKAREPIATSETHVRRRSRTKPASSVAAEDQPPRRKDNGNQRESQTSLSLVSIGLISALAILSCLALLSRVELISSWRKILDLSSPLADSAENNINITSTSKHWWTDGGRRFDIPLNPQDHIHRPSRRLEFNWVVSSGFRRPDGVKKRVYLVNNEFPGPTIEARSGDELKIWVRNDLDEGEDIAIHWHGLWMRDANDMDGAVGFTQCQIKPGENFTYEFKISNDQHGTFWYHAHDQVQRADGLLGGLIIHEPHGNSHRTSGLELPTYDHERLLLISDWYHRPATAVMKWYMRAGSYGMEPVPDSIIVNHGGAYNCTEAAKSRPVDCVQILPSELPRVEVSTGSRYRFRIINSGTLAGFTLRFPTASLLPLQVDGGNPINNNGSVESIGILYPGERVDFVASWSASSKASTASLEIELDNESFRYPNPALTLVHQFPVTVNGEMEPDPNTTVPAGGHFSLVSAKSPNSTNGPSHPETASLTFVLYTTTMRLARLSNVPYGFMNHTSWKPQEDPPLPLISLPRSQWDKHQLVPHIKSSRQDPIWVDIVLNNLDDGSHPFHLHGYEFWVLSIHSGGSYWGSYNPFDAPDGPPGGAFNLVDPVKKDTVFVPSRGYAVLRFLADNEGLWMFHCHILWHQASGMAMGFLVNSEDATEPPLESLNLSNRQQLRDNCKTK